MSRAGLIILVYGGLGAVALVWGAVRLLGPVLIAIEALVRSILRVAGWRVSLFLMTDFVLDALEQPIYGGRDSGRPA